MSSSNHIRKFLVPIFLIVILTVSMLAVYVSYSHESQTKADPNTYVGIAFGGNTTSEAKVLIDKVKGYTNLFILDVGRNPISENQTKVEEICDYAVSNGLSVIVNVGIKDSSPNASWGWFWNQSSLDSVKQRWTEKWGSKFLGMYYNDEPGGLQLDGDWWNFYLTYGENLSQIYPPQPAIEALIQARVALSHEMLSRTSDPPRSFIMVPL